MKENSSSKQLAINMASTMVSFIVGVGVSFYLTPFVVGSLGADAYGFIGLSNNIINYSALLTIALNSMAGRFITISYTQGKINDANKYFTSVFYSNIAISLFILTIMLLCVIYLDCMLEVPTALLFDVKLLFSLLAANSILAISTNIYSISTFVKNRLELASIRTIIGNLIRGISLVLLFGLFPARLWYVGISSLVVTSYIAFTNYKLTKWITPEITVQRHFFDFNKIKELLLSGMWNVLSKLNEILAQGLDLVVANIFIGSTAMGIFSITKIVPTFVYSFFSSLGGIFAPNLTQLYAQGRMEEMKNKLLQSIRIMGFIATIPTVCLYSFGFEFYSLWMPTQNAYHLYILTVLGTFASVFSMPLEGLWNIFTITNRIKTSSIFVTSQSIVSFVIILLVLPYVDGVFNKLCVFSSVRLIISFIKNLFFLPIFGAKCLSFNINTFYPPLVKSFLCFSISFAIGYIIHLNIIVDNWIMLFMLLVIVSFVCVIVNYAVILSNNDKKYINGIIIRKLQIKKYFKDV